MEKSRLVRFAIRLIRLYRAASSLGLPRCRFYPSCSAYAEAALTQHGFLKGTGRTLMRLLRCHPLHRGGYDPVLP